MANLIRSVIIEGDFIRARKLINTQLSIDSLDETGVTPLVLAITYKQINVIKLLLEVGADINIQYPLMIAVRNGCDEGVKLLLINGADPNKRDVDNETPLLVASRQGNIVCMRYLLEYKADCNVLDINKNTPLTICGRNGYADCMKFLIECGALIDHVNKYDRSALSEAMKNKQYHCAEILVEAGAKPVWDDVSDLDIPKNLFIKMISDPRVGPNLLDMDESLLTWFGRFSREEKVSILLEHGADCNWTHSQNGNTALIDAAYMNRTSILSLLLDAGANPFIRNNSGHIAYDYASSECKPLLINAMTPIEHS